MFHIWNNLKGKELSITKLRKIEDVLDYLKQVAAKRNFTNLTISDDPENR
jgi:hypothetical protein